MTTPHVVTTQFWDHATLWTANEHDAGHTTDGGRVFGITRTRYVECDRYGCAPVAVIPDSRVEIERLRDLFDAAYAEYTGSLTARLRGERANALQAALREYANPAPRIYREHPGALAPWPEVGECHRSHVGGSRSKPWVWIHAMTSHECPQCAWEHVHEWVAWTHPQAVKTHGIPVRCSKCGGRKCDKDDCLLQRHHDGDHSPTQDGPA